MKLADTPVLDSATRGVALVVDDEGASRLLLQRLLERERYRVVTASHGMEALEQYARHEPDIVFLDVMLPDLHGYEVSRRIKQAAGDHFVPVFFLTSLSEEEALSESVDAGGDGFLTKPCKYPILRARLQAIERIRDIYERARRQHAEIRRMHARTQFEQEFAERLLTGAVMAANVAEPPVQKLLRSASTFNGDLLISTHTPSGGIAMLLGDFTGHGLAAAIGALPVSETFRAMTSRGYGLMDVLAEINRKLHRLLPASMFFAATALRIEPGLRSATIWNSGMPDVIVRGANGVKQRIRSLHPPLGALGEFLPGTSPRYIEMVRGDVVVLHSDGVTEASSAEGEMFGEIRFEQALIAAPAHGVFHAICAALDAHIGNAEQADDISLAVVPCEEGLFPHRDAAVVQEMTSFAAAGTEWNWSLEVSGSNLARIDPVPLAMNQLTAFGVPASHRQQVFLVLTELYSNALEHGVLNLSSDCKATPEGFLAYYEARERALSALQRGSVRIEMRNFSNGRGGGALRIAMRDSGAGFDYRTLPVCTPSMPDDDKSGRGICLVHSLCEQVRYSGNGNCVEVVYAY